METTRSSHFRLKHETSQVFAQWSLAKLRKTSFKEPNRSLINQEKSCCSSDCTCVVCGCESVGKTQLLASLTGKLPLPENFRGSTIACESYRDGAIHWIDTPGLIRESETATTRFALDAIDEADRVMLVARADRAAEELPALLKTTAGKPGFVALTFTDKISNKEDLKAEELSQTLGVPVIPVDARKLSDTDTAFIKALAAAHTNKLSNFPEPPSVTLPLPPPTSDPSVSALDKAISSPPVALLLLFLPAVISVMYANQFADWLYDPVDALIGPLLDTISTWPSLLSTLFGGSYGLVAMFPFLLLYAAPTILVFSLILAVYKSSGLIDRMSVALHPLLRPFGIGGRDLVRVVMGFGCNVPAIVSSRSCHSCSRGACVSAISFGSACSYQLPATLAVFAAAGMAGMGLAYLVVLALTTLIYLRFTTPKILRNATNNLLVQKANALQRPSWKSVWREVAGNMKQFVVMAFPVFVVICFVAALLDWLGAIAVFSNICAPLMTLFNLPSDAATSVILGAVRKDGIAIGLLDGSSEGLKVALQTPAQVFTAVYLAGVLLPCLVTVFTVVREMRWKFALKLCGRQMLWASGFALIFAWGGALLYT